MCDQVFTGSVAVPVALRIPPPVVVKWPAGRFAVASLEYSSYAICAPASFSRTVRQPVEFAGLTHASSVIALERSSEFESATVAMSFTPSNDRALPPPVRPLATNVAPPVVALLPRPDESLAVVAPGAWLKPSARTRPVDGPVTVTVTVPVADPPRPSPTV